MRGAGRGAGVYGLKCSKPERAGRSAGRSAGREPGVAVRRCAGVSGAKTPRARNDSGPEAAGWVCGQRANEGKYFMYCTRWKLSLIHI